MSSDRVALQERLRLQTLARYFAPLEITADIVRASHDEPRAPTLSNSTQLTAITQNGALRLQCDRAFVSLIDASTQYVVAEATRSISLRNSAKHATQDDALFLGVQALDKSYGICPNSIAIFTDATGGMSVDTRAVVANHSRYVIRDLRELELYKDRPYVVGFPYMRSYVEVPIKSSQGQILGTYCAVDTKVRHDFFSDDTIDTLTEIADCITEHLELQSIKHNSLRGDRLMGGLSDFTKGNSHIADRSIPLKALDTTLPFPETSHRQHQPPFPPVDAMAGYFPSSVCPTRPRRVTTASTASTSSTFSTSDHTSYTSPTAVVEDSTSPLTSPLESPFSSSLPAYPSSISDQRRNPRSSRSSLSASGGIFTRAADLIRSAIDLEGLVFLDASTRNTTETTDPALFCEVLGSSLASKDCALSSSNVPLVLHETSLSYLVQRYPHGCVLSADDYGFLAPGDSETNPDEDDGHIHESPSSESEVPEELRNLVATARSIIFLPLWDFSKQRFFVGLMGWSKDPTRVFEDQDMTCLSAFGVTLMSELARSEAVDIARTKSDFVASLSHELRSPLHGILASAEILQEQENGENQYDLIDMIQSCGSTLMDTLNHLLDFSRINGFTDIKGQVRRTSSNAIDKPFADAFGQDTKLYLCGLVQDVVEGVHFGQNSLKATLHREQTGLRVADRDEPVDPTTLIGGGHDIGDLAKLTDDAVGVYLDLENRADWCVTLHGGAWKRLVMNLFANSLKYTQRGHIEISLKMVGDPQDKTSSRNFAHLTIKDTGIGMSEDYVKHHLYTPFVQENPLANGTGLGLSIVKQIVAEGLDGTISVQSTPGSGTRFDVIVPLLEIDDCTEVGVLPGGHVLDPKGVLRGRTICLLSQPYSPPPNSENNIEPDYARQRTKLLHSHITSAATQWFGMKVVSAERLVEADADFVFVESSQMNDLMFANSGTTDGAGKQRIILIDTSTAVSDSSGKFRGNITRLAYPIGPKTLKKVLFASLKGPKEKVRNFRIGGREVVRKRKASDPAVKGSDRSTQTGSKAAPAFLNDAAGEVTSHSIRNDEEPERRSTPQHHLLLVDDNAINLKILSTYVQKLGFTAEKAENGLEACERFKTSTKPFSMVLMDLSMPVMDGFEASRQIRDYESKHVERLSQPTKIVALTGLGSQSSRQEAVLSGIDDYRTKPVSLKTLREILQVPQ